MSFLSTRSSWGKIIGGILGLLYAGPWGGAFGFLIGHMYDQSNDAKPQNSWGNSQHFSGNSTQAVFNLGIIVLSAKMAKSDGRVTRAEIEAFKKFFRITPQQENAIGLIFNEARLNAEGFEPHAFRLASVFQRSPAVLEEVLSGLFYIGLADSAVMSPAETHFLKRVAFIFGFDAEAFARIAARSGVNLPEREKPKHPQAESFAILGVKETATGVEIKAAYRALIREHHPDKLMAQGMSPAFVANATEKMKRINVAYDTLSKLKGIK